jgi:cytochrome c556
MHTRALPLIVTLACCLAWPCAGHAQLNSADAAIRHRKAAFTLMNTYFVRLYQITEGERAYRREEAIEYARLVETLSRLPWAGFTPGSEHGTGRGNDRVITKAKPEIWLEEERFRQLAERMQNETSRLHAAAQSGDARALKAAFGKARESCQACHQVFRAD